MKAALPKALADAYEQSAGKIRERLDEFAAVAPESYFYEFCFCVCTPQSKAESAFRVQRKLEEADFARREVDPEPILRDPEHYIRFHKQKAKRLLWARENFDSIAEILESRFSTPEKRLLIRRLAPGFGLKESSHFLRNVGYRGLAILDRHLLKHLVLCGVFKESPKISSDAQYFSAEAKSLEFAAHVGVPIDELDVLFWSYETNIILK